MKHLLPIKTVRLSGVDYTRIRWDGVRLHV